MNPGRNQIYASTIRRMVEQSLRRQEWEFRQQYEHAPERELLEYLRQWAGELGHTPHPGEICGWELLQERFGTWEALLEAAGLPAPDTPAKPSRFARVEEEYRIQKAIYRMRKERKRL